MLDQFWKVVYGIPRRSQKVTRSATGSVMAILTLKPFEQQMGVTFALLGEQEVGLCGGRKVGHTIASIQKHWPFTIRQSSVWLDLQGLVMTKVA